MRKTILALLCVCFLSGCVFDSERSGGDVQPGDRLPEFSVRMDDGSVLRSEDLAAGPSLLIFFHTGCPDCRRTLPLVQQAYENYPDIRFAAVSREEAEAEVRAWWTENGLTLPFAAQEGRGVYALFAASGIPRIYLSGTGGTVTACFDDDPCPEYADLVRELERLR